MVVQDAKNTNEIKIIIRIFSYLLSLIRFQSAL